MRPHPPGHILVVLLGLHLACASTTSSGQGRTHSRLEQDSATAGCMRTTACYSQTGSDAVLPWVGPAVRTAETAIAVMRVLEAADVARIEQLLVECAKQADFEVNEREYGEGKRPDDAECDRVVGTGKKGDPVLRRMELGTMKHEVAFNCVRDKILKLFPENVSIEPRYGKDPATRQWVLTQWRTGSLKPDIVLHASRATSKVQCIYDFKFPCLSSHKSDPFKDRRVVAQMREYEQLGGNCTPAIITPQLGVSRD